jgi:hypothetical protein
MGYDKIFKEEGKTFKINVLNVVPGAGLNSRMNKDFAWVWGIIFVPHKKFHFGVNWAQQGQSGKDEPIRMIGCLLNTLAIG